MVRALLAAQRITGDTVLVHDSLGLALLRNALLTEHTAPQASIASRMIPNQPAEAAGLQPTRGQQASQQCAPLSAAQPAASMQLLAPQHEPASMLPLQGGQGQR